MSERMEYLLSQLEPFADQIDEANERVVARMRDAQPALVDVQVARDVIPELAGERRTLLHAGPPISWEDMCPPMKGSCIGAVLFEGWASDEAGALELLGSGQIRLMPNHEAHAVGPMSGLTSPSMPVLVVENRLDGTRAFCTINEGGGNVLRFGAYDQEVVDRLHWMADVLAPLLSAALRSSRDGVNINVLMAKAITMGDDFHMRNAASSLVILKELLCLIAPLEWDEDEKRACIEFISAADQFFLNVVMATGKAIVDCARKVEEGCVVTTLCRNGHDFGIRISGLGDQWFCAPVVEPNGLYFTGFSAEDANPDIGDSAICETIGVGGMAMVASPAVTRFLGAGGYPEALAYSNAQEKICIAHNPNWSIPTWDFKGTNLGIDLRRVIETGITPTINTAISHKEAGHGMVGAGTAQAPLACFERALEAYCAKLGIE
ncbi:MAG: DUF1116 domain-containing protein [Olsenella sp.]|nr:DUF1116 domain-containing protein [Olsenella sp.]